MSKGLHPSVSGRVQLLVSWGTIHRLLRPPRPLPGSDLPATSEKRAALNKVINLAATIAEKGLFKEKKLSVSVARKSPTHRVLHTIAQRHPRGGGALSLSKPPRSSNEKLLTFAFCSPIVRAVEETGNGWRAGSIAVKALTRRPPPVESSEP